MAKFRKTQNRFWSGILSKKLKGSFDLEEYQSGCFQMENFLGSSSGGAYQRPGSFFMTDKIYGASGFDSSLDSSDLDDLYMFEINENVTGIIRFISGGTNSDYFLVTYNNTTGNVIDRSSSTTNSGTMQTYNSEMVYDTTEKASGLRHIKVGDIFFFVHNSGTIPPFVISMYGNSVRWVSYIHKDTGVNDYFSLSSAFRIPYDSLNIDPNLLFHNISIASSSTTVEMRNSGGTPQSYWTSADLGTVYEVVSGTSAYWGYISAILSGTQATLYITNYTTTPIPAGTSTKIWRRSSWGGSYGFPTCVFSAAGRVGFASSPQYPMSMWFGLQGNAYHFMGGRISISYTENKNFPSYSGSIESRDAFTFDITGQESSEIQWVVASRNLEIGTDKEEFTYTGFDAADPSANSVLYQSSIGSSDTLPIKVGNATFFVGQDGVAVQQILFDFNRSANSIKNISLLSEDLFFSDSSSVITQEASGGVEIKKMVYQRELSTVWVLTNLGELFSILIDPTSSAIGWQKHTLGVPDGEYVKVVDICLGRLYVSSLIQKNRRTLSLITQRSANSDFSSSTYSIETMGFDTPTDDLNTALHPATQKLDCACAAYSATAKTSFVAADFVDGTSGYTNTNNILTNKTVHVIADGIYIGEKTLSGNDLTLDTAASRVVIGLYADAILETVPPQLPSQFGSHMESYRRFDRVEVQFYKSKYAEVGTPNSDTRPVVFASDSTLETIDHIQPLSANSEQEQTVLVKNTKPVPCNILSITARGVLAD